VVLISACLLGVSCRYDGAAKPLRSFPPELAGDALLPVCPEELAGLPTPRLAADFTDGDGAAVLAGRSRVVRADGLDLTASFLRGANCVVAIAERWGVKRAYFKSRSPSCGAGSTLGVTTAALRAAGVEVIELD
jgi:uncharacterized protein YbbK (DUF523 family)